MFNVLQWKKTRCKQRTTIFSNRFSLKTLFFDIQDKLRFTFTQNLTLIKIELKKGRHKIVSNYLKMALFRLEVSNL